MLSAEQERLCRAIDQRYADKATITRFSSSRSDRKVRVEWTATLIISHGQALGRLWGIQDVT